MPEAYDFSDEPLDDVMAQGFDAGATDNSPSRPPLPMTRRQAQVQENPNEEEQQLQEDVPQEESYREGPPDDEEQEEDYQEVVGDVDRRLKIATYFRLILDGSLFGDDTLEAKIVQKKIKSFAKAEIEVLAYIERR